MIEGIPWPAVTAGSGGWLVAFFFCISLIRGKIVPKSTVDTLEAYYKQQVEDISHDRTEWRAAHRISESARQVSANQTEELLEQGRTTNAFIRSLPDPGRAEA